MRHDSQYPLRQAHYVSHSTDFANRAFKSVLGIELLLVERDANVGWAVRSISSRHVR